MFETLLDRVRENVMRVMMTVHVQTRQEMEEQQRLAQEAEAQAQMMADQAAQKAQGARELQGEQANHTVRDDEGNELSFTGMSPYGVDLDKVDWRGVSRNAQCPCGSGKKFKNCHGHIA